MSKKKRNKASKRQRPNTAREVVPQSPAKVASPAPDVLPMASAAARAEPERNSTRPAATAAGAPAHAAGPKAAAPKPASKAAPVLDAQLVDETPRFWVGAATLAAGGFLLASVVTALVKGVPAEGQSVNTTTGAVRGLIDLFGPLGLIVASGTLVALMVWALVSTRRLAWLPIGGALPLLAVGCAWLFGQGRLGALFAGDLRILGGVLGAVVLSGATLALAHAFGWSISDYLRRERDEAKSDEDDEVEAVRPLQRTETKRSAVETKTSAPVVAQAPTFVAPMAVAPIPVAPTAVPVATSFATPAAAPIAPKPAPASLVAPLGTAAAAVASGELELRILKRGQPVPAKGEIAVEPHEGEINEPRPYTPPSKPKATIVAAAAPRRDVSFVSVESGAVAAAVAGPVLRPKLSEDAMPFTPRGAAPAVVEVEVPEEIDEEELEDDLDDDEEYASDEEDDLDDEEDESEESEDESKNGAVAPVGGSLTAVAGGDDDGWVEVGGDDDEEDEDDDEDEDDEDEDEEEEEEEEEWVEGDEPELRVAPLAGDDREEEDSDEEADEEEPLVVAAALTDDTDDEDADEDESAEDVLPIAAAAAPSKRHAPVEEESDADADDRSEPVTELAPAARAPRKRSRGRGRGREAQASLFEAPVESAPAMDIDDKLVYEAGRVFLEEGRVAVSMLQRRFGLDFKQSTAILDQLQQRGLIGPYLGGSRREILMDAKTWRAAVAQGA